MISDPVGARELILARVRAALADVPADEPLQEVASEIHGPGDRPPADPAALVDLLYANLTDYRARVHRSSPGELPATIARLLTRRASRRVVVPGGLPDEWLADADADRIAEDGMPTARQLDSADSVVTGCAVAIAETGTIVLDGGPGQGRRVLTLMVDHHICVVHVHGQVVASPLQALRRLAPERPQTWISGPSATSDIELDRVEGVHGPRVLEVVLVSD